MKSEDTLVKMMELIRTGRSVTKDRDRAQVIPLLLPADQILPQWDYHAEAEQLITEVEMVGDDVRQLVLGNARVIQAHRADLVLILRPLGLSYLYAEEDQ